MCISNAAEFRVMTGTLLPRRLSSWHDLIENQYEPEEKE
jgi:hypothetical protein